MPDRNRLKKGDIRRIVIVSHSIFAFYFASGKLTASFQNKASVLIDSDIVSTASIVGRDWTHGEYYDWAERSMDSQWEHLIWPFISDADFSRVVEIAAGHGRNTAKLASLSKSIIASDINETNCDYLRKRFTGNASVSVLLNSGADLRDIPGADATFVYCFDAMVHFDSDVIRSYIKEIRRVLKPGGRAFCHYSAFDKNPTGSYRDHPGWRNFMTKGLFEHWVAKEGMRLLRSSYVDRLTYLTDNPDGADGMTYFELPADAQPASAFWSTDETLRTTMKDLELRREEISQLQSRIAELDSALATLRTQADQVQADSETWRQKFSHISAQAEDARLRIGELESSTSWRITSPLRRLASMFR